MNVATIRENGFVAWAGEGMGEGKDLPALGCL